MWILLLLIVAQSGEGSAEPKILFVEQPFGDATETRDMSLTGTWILKERGQKSQTFEIVADFPRSSERDAHVTEFLSFSIRERTRRRRVSSDSNTSNELAHGRALVYRIESETFMVVGRFLGRFPESVNDIFVVPVFCVLRVAKCGDTVKLYNLDRDAVLRWCKEEGIQHIEGGQDFVFVSCSRQDLRRLIQVKGVFGNRPALTLSKAIAPKEENKPTSEPRRSAGGEPKREE